MRTTNFTYFQLLGRIKVGHCTLCLQLEKKSIPCGTPLSIYWVRATPLNPFITFIGILSNRQPVPQRRLVEIKGVTSNTTKSGTHTVSQDVDSRRTQTIFVAKKFGERNLQIKNLNKGLFTLSSVTWWFIYWQNIQMVYFFQI